MSDLSKVDLFTDYEDVEIIELPPFTFGIWRISNTENLDDLAHLSGNGITKDVLERYGRTVLSIDLDGGEDAADGPRERLREIYRAMPTSESSMAQLHMSDARDGISSVHVYGDDIPMAIEACRHGVCERSQRSGTVQRLS